MNNENVNKKSVSEPSTEYETPKRSQGIGKDFDFEKEFANGLTVEEAKAEMHRRISQWKWEK
ncbi:hypothetical protein [Flavobacterium sp.]|jgi:hypothetical protein|uniref:hypothetical protein n=1 Tax=Flavobacterium sp. TaxID=239 RepID=UPI0037BF5B7E